MWVFNGSAIIAVGIGIAGAILLVFTTENRPLALIVGILVAMGADVWMRFRSEDSERPLIDPDAGAHIWFAQVWAVGIILMVLLGLSHLRII